MKKLKIIHKRLDSPDAALLAKAHKEGFIIGAMVQNINSGHADGKIIELKVIDPNIVVGYSSGWNTLSIASKQQEGEFFVAARYGEDGDQFSVFASPISILTVVE